jgi:xanthine/uracil/vitamin C permease (AzgA family)
MALSSSSSRISIASSRSAGWPTVVFALGLGLLITLWVRKVKGAIIISILVMTVVAFVVEAIAKSFN